ncbi:hypothetical protein UlMin_042822 [Ulmus minor]
MPLNRNPSHSNLSPNTRWWLQMQPNYGYQKGFSYEQLNALEPEEEAFTCDTHKWKENIDDQKNSECFSSEVGKQDVKSLCGKDMGELLQLDDTTDSCGITQMDLIDDQDAKHPKELCFDSEYSWIGSEKSAPWWRMTDRDELVSLVARKSLDHIENCDLPPPQKICRGRHTCTGVGSFNNEKVSASSLDWKSQTGGLSIGSVNSNNFANSGDTHESQGCLNEERHLHCASDELRSYCNTDKSMTETQGSDGELSKEQLMEALCHSQTRARKAEKAAKRAFAEKEHVVTLFFKQASLLFAYKQWFQLLQLESFYVQLKKNDQQMSALSPLALPLMSCKGRKPRKSRRKDAKVKGERRGEPNHDITKYAVAFALGLSLVGAGLFLGWTVGWMLPSF